MQRVLATLGLLLLVCSFSVAQQVTLNYPFTSSSDGFFEHFGVGLNFRTSSPNSSMFFSSGNSMSTIPAFGGYDPSAASNFGFGGVNGNTSWGLNFTAAQGSTRSSVTTSPSITVPNGGFGFLNNTVQRPFVTSIVPVVNGNPRPLFNDRAGIFAAGTQRYLAESQLREQQEKEELESAREQSKQRTKYRQRKQDDPPLILGSGRSSSR